MIRKFAVLEKVDGRQPADTELVGNVFGSFNVNAVETYPAIKILGKPLNDGVHDCAFAQPVGSENNKEGLAVSFFEEPLELLFADCRVY